MATKMLAASLQAVAGEGKKALTCVILNPKAMQIEQLYGHFEKDEWKVYTIFFSFEAVVKISAITSL